jgi:hypothetical protein
MNAITRPSAFIPLSVKTLETKIMRLHKLLLTPVALLVLLSAVPSAFAGSAGVTNSWKTRDIKNGKYEMKVNVDDKYYYNRDAKATAWKKEYGATVITDNDYKSDKGVKDSSKSYNNDDSTKFTEVDYYKAGAESYNKEWGYGHTFTDVSVKETYDFSGFEKTHSVSSDFSY